MRRLWGPLNQKWTGSVLVDGVVDGVGPRIFKYRTDRLLLSPDSHPDNL